MYSLTKEQKLANISELIDQKKQKIENLQREIENLQAKSSKLLVAEEKQATQKTDNSVTSRTNYADIASNWS